MRCFCRTCTYKTPAMKTLYFKNVWQHVLSCQAVARSWTGHCLIKKVFQAKGDANITPQCSTEPSTINVNRAHESIFDRSAYIVSGGRGEGGGEQLEACLEQSKGPYLLSSKKITLFASDGSVFGFAPSSLYDNAWGKAHDFSRKAYVTFPRKVER
jgi:hypothetical protein